MMTLAICTRATEGMQDSVRATLEGALLDPAVDTPLEKSLGSTATVVHFLAICRTFRSGGTRIRTGDTMIFSHLQKPIGMRKTRIGKRIYVQGVPLDTIWFCPYCCATVDYGFRYSEGHRKQDTYIYSPNLNLMNEDVGVAIGIAQQWIGTFIYSAKCWSSVSYS